MNNKLKRITGLVIALVMVVTLIPATPLKASTKSGSTFTSAVGTSWVRDTTKGHSPLTFGECFSNTYCLEVDYLSYSTAFTVLVSKTKFNAVKSLVETAGTTAAAAGVVKFAAAMGYTVSGIAGAAVSVVIGFGYAIIAALDTSSYNKACDGLKNYQMIKVSFMTANGNLVKCYEKYTPSSRTIRGSGSNTYTVANPYSGTYGTWYTGKYGKLYRL